MRSILFILVFTVTVARLGYAEHLAPRFMATVQMAVHEQTPELLNRSHKLVIDRFDQTFRGSPDFKGSQYDVRTSGNEVIFSLVSAKDPRESLPAMVMAWTQGLNGRLLGRGRSSVYRIDLPQMGQDGPVVYIDAPTDSEGKAKILYIVARMARLGDILAALKAKVKNFSYFVRMPAECADSFMIDYDFGDPQSEKLHEVPVVLKHLQAALDMEVQTLPEELYVFKLKQCPQPVRSKRPPEPEFLESSFLFKRISATEPQVSFPVPALE